MRPILSVIIFNFILIRAEGQQTLPIPQLENLNSKDIYPTNTVLSSYTTAFDIIISLKGYSNWGPDHSIKMLAFNKSGWYRIEINSDRFHLDPSICHATYKINDTIGKKIWDTLLANHLFEMEDERTKYLKCIGKTDTIKNTDGTPTNIESPGISVDDGSEYDFEIITKDSYKKLYFYEPKEYNEYCRKVDERTWILNCISIFGKYLGK